MIPFDERVFAITGLICDQDLAAKITARLREIAAHTIGSDFGLVLDNFLNNFHGALPCGTWIWNYMEERPYEPSGFFCQGRELTHQEHITRVGAILKEYDIDITLLEYEGYRSDNWNEVRWIDFKIFCLLLNQGYDWSSLTV